MHVCATILCIMYNGISTMNFVLCTVHYSINAYLCYWEPSILGLFDSIIISVFQLSFVAFVNLETFFGSPLTYL